MKVLNSFLVCFMILTSFFAFTACSSKGEIKGCSYSLIANGEEYEIGQEYKMFSEGPSGNLTIPETYKDKKITSIGSFACCHKITNVIGNKNITTITKNAFGCRCQGSTTRGTMKLKSVEFPQEGNLKNIENYAFYKCSNLEKIVIPKNFESFGRGVFYCCLNLKSIYIYNTTPPTGASTLFDDEVYSHLAPEGLTIYVSTESLEVYQNSNWSSYNIQAINL